MKAKAIPMLIKKTKISFVRRPNRSMIGDFKKYSLKSVMLKKF